MKAYLGAIDQGTTSTRFMVFDRAGRIVSVAQKEHEQIFPKPGWVEHDPDEIWARTREVIDDAMQARGLRPEELAASGITNQRETTVVWNSKTGRPVHNALVWQDTRVEDAVAEFSKDGGQDRFRDRPADGKVWCALGKYGKCSAGRSPGSAAVFPHEPACARPPRTKVRATLKGIPR